MLGNEKETRKIWKALHPRAEEKVPRSTQCTPAQSFPSRETNVTHWKIFISMLHAPVCQIWVVKKNNEERQKITTFSLNQGEQMSLLDVCQYWGEKEREGKEERKEEERKKTLKKPWIRKGRILCDKIT